MHRKGWWMSISCTSFYKNIGLAVIAGLVASPAHAQLSQLLQVGKQEPTALPSELMLDGQPIDPLCFEAVSADEWVDISKCSDAKIIKLPAESDGFAADKVGYRYRYQEDKSDAVSYSYYQYIGSWNGAPVVLSYGSGGGTGQFTSLISIERNGNKIRVLQGFGAGDRCNGGIVDAKISLGTLYYGQNMTPIDFLQIADDNPQGLQPYDDLEASASSCFGIARFEDEKFVGVTLQDVPKSNDTSTTYKYQSCFNRLFHDQLAKGKKELSVSALKEFTAQFNQVCLSDVPVR